MWMIEVKLEMGLNLWRMHTDLQEIGSSRLSAWCARVRMWSDVAVLCVCVYISGRSTWLWGKCWSGTESHGIMWPDARWTHNSPWCQLYTESFCFYLHHSATPHKIGFAQLFSTAEGTVWSLLSLCLSVSELVMKKNCRLISKKFSGSVAYGKIS